MTNLLQHGAVSRERDQPSSPPRPATNIRNMGIFGAKHEVESDKEAQGIKLLRKTLNVIDDRREVTANRHVIEEWICRVEPGAMRTSIAATRRYNRNNTRTTKCTGCATPKFAAQVCACACA